MKKFFALICIALLLVGCGPQGNDKENQMPMKLYVVDSAEWNLAQPEIYKKCHLGRYYEAQDGVFYLVMSNVDAAEGATCYRWGYDVNTGEDWVEEISETDFEATKRRREDVKETGYDTYTDYGGYRYFIRGIQISCMDLTTEKTQVVFDIIQNAVGYGVYDLAVNDQGMLCLLSGNGEKNNIYILSAEPPEITGDPTRLVSLTSDDLLLPQLSVEYGRTHPENPVIYEKEEDTENLRTKVFAELAAGHGPDMLWVSREDMYVLAQKGLLQDMTELIDTDTLGQIFPGILQAGTVDGKMLGLVPQTSVFYMVTTDNIWKKESWNPQQVVDLIGSHSNLKGVFGYGLFTSRNMNEEELLTELILRDINNSVFINWEERKCSFYSEEFIRTLEIVRSYGKEESYSDEYFLDFLENGEFLAWRGAISGISNYAEIRNLLGNKGHFVGLPTSEAYSGFWVCNHFLVINKNSQHMDTIKDFLKELLSEENQGRAMLISVREDAIRSNMEPITINEYGEKTDVYVNNDGLIMEVEVKPDGTSYLEEYIDFLKKCGPIPYSDETIQEIILEEAEMFFSGVKTAEQTAEVIQNRVQLYLDM